MNSQPRPATKAPQRRGMSAMLRRLAARRAAHALAALVLGAALAPHAQAQTLYWDADGNNTSATGGTGIWDLLSSLWRNGSATGTLQTYTPNTNPSTVTAYFGGTAGTVTIASGNTINVNNLTFGVGGYTLAGANSTSVINVSGTTPTITGNGITTISAKITGTQGFTQTGGSFTIFTGDLTGLTGTVNDNTRINLDGTTETGSQFQTWNIASGATLSSENHGTTSTIQLGALTGSGTLRIGNNGAGVTDSGTDTFQIGALNTSTTFSGTITNHNAALTAITKVGTGTLTLTGANSYTGATTISAGALQIGNGGATGSLGSTSGIIDNGALVFNLSTSFQTASNNPVISGSGTVTIGGTAPVILTGTNTYTGLTTINSGGTLQISANGTSATLGSGNVLDNGTLVFNRQNAITAGNVISGTGAVSQTGTGNLTLSGSNSYQGGTNVSAGTLMLGSTSALGATTGALNVNAAGTLNMNGYGASAGALTSTGGTFTGFNLGGSGNSLAATSATLSGTTYVGINPASITGLGTSNLITSSGGGLTGAFQFAGAQDLSVPVNSLIVKSGSSFYRATLNNSANAEQITVSSSPSKVLSVMPLGASIMAGVSTQANYNGGGFHTQLYQDLVNDGRFTPNFVGSNTDLQTNNPVHQNLLTSAGETNSEGHSGYTTSQNLNNLNANDGSGGNNGGNWLSATNPATTGVNSPNYVVLNSGGNDYAQGATDSVPVNRYDAIISQLNTLRPGVDTLATNLLFRSDVGNAETTYFNPYVQGVVYNHVLAGQNVQFVDLYNLITPNNSLANIGPDNIHPTQAGYNLMANVLYNSTAYGTAYYTGNAGGAWNTVNGSSTNFAMDAARTTDRGKTLNDPTTLGNAYAGTSDAYPDVSFNSNTAPLATTLGADTTVRSLNFAGGATGAVSVGGPNTLSIGSGGITVQAGTGTHTVSSNIALTSDQTWGNVSSNPLTISGGVSGSSNLTIAGSYTLYTVPSAYASASDASAHIVAQTVTGTGAIVLTGADTYTGSTTINPYGMLQIGNGGATGSLSPSSTITDNGTLTFNRSNTIRQGTDFAGVISGSGSVAQNGTGTLVLTGANTYSGGTTISRGGLQMSNTTGSATGISVVTLSGGTTVLSGTGFSTGPISVSNAGVLAPGANTVGNYASAGTLTVGATGGAALTNAVLDFDLASTATGGSDMIVTGGPLTLGALKFNFNELTPGTLDTTNVYTLIAGASSETGFSPANITTSFIGGNYTPAYSLNGNNLQVKFSSVPGVPEPSQAAALGLGILSLGGLLLTARKRRMSDKNA